MNPRAIAKQALLKTVGVATRRHPVLLPQAAADEANLLEVVAPYRVDGEVAGTVGVLGPTRMDYRQALAAVEAISQQLGRVLS